MRALVLAAVLGALACACATARSSEAVARKEVEARLRALVDSSERRDAAASAAMHAEDALLLPPGGDVVRGRAAIQAFSGLPPDADVGDTEIETLVFRADGPLAWHAGRFAYTATDARGARRVRGRFLMVWERQDGEWRLAGDMWSVDG